MKKVNQHYYLINSTPICAQYSKYKYKILISSHADENVEKFNIILPIRHYFEETDIFLIFKVLFKYSNRVIDNSRIFILFL